MSREAEELAERQHYEQFEPDMTSEPGMFTAEELKHINQDLEQQLAEPIPLNRVPF